MTVFVVNNIEALHNAQSRCAKCGSLTESKVMTPSVRPEYEERLYECLDCGHAETVFVKLNTLAQAGLASLRS